MRYGQLVIGGAGSGKTTYCRGLADLLTQLNRKFAVINLDAGNGVGNFSFPVDVRELVTVEEIGNSESLGPNGSLLYCMEQVVCDFHWLEGKIREFSEDTYLVIDCPGQIELYTQSDVIANLIDLLRRRLAVNLVCVNLVDSVLIHDKFHYLSGLLASLASMLRLELPHVNVLSKVDLLKTQIGNFENGLSFRSAMACGEEDLRRILQFEDESDKLAGKLVGNLAELIEDYGLVGFQPLAVEDKELMLRLLSICDRSCGFSCNNPQAMTLEISSESREDFLTSVEEKYLEDEASLGGCAACRNPQASLQCSRCKAVKYCDRACQAEHWKNLHRLQCRPSSTNH